MVLLLILYPLVILALVGIAIYEHITTTTLSLPVSPAITILTILLPLLSPFTTLATPHLFHFRNHKRTSRQSNNVPSLPPLLLHLFQLLLTTVLATLFTTPLTSPSTTRCLLESKWRSLWTAHNAPAIRAVQDALSCCGFRSTQDMAWPFPSRTHPSTATCETQFRRHDPCLPGWVGELRRVLVGEIGVVICVGVIQVVSVVLGMRGGFRWGESAFGGGWMSGLERLWNGSGREGAEGSRRPLLAAPEDTTTGRERGRVVETGYSGRVDEDEVGDGEAGEEEEEEVQQRSGEGGYGGTGRGPRVEPAHHDAWAGVQRV
ncbi:hypothetical protein VTI74DRAFT_9104 [Chaetomium olivicolor]